MGEIKKTSTVKLFTAVMYRRDFDFQAAVNALTAVYGDIETSFGPVEFSWSNYYGDEMGEGLLKFYVVFKERIERTRLPSIKIHTNELEQQFLGTNGKRAVNIDPGYIAVDKLVLASTKDFYHRVYLGSGIFAEVTLHYRRGCYRHFSWTYPDYQSPSFLVFLEAARP
ncbi:MAG: DUF4416 family protein [Chitinispirillales bacterium]|jgi:hypothetical protein|nr:DUF4416 family protein [Chitinispirillales bacterium]